MLMTRDDVLKFWQERFGGPPTTWLDDELASVRFHSLPGSDQYPRCHADKVELLKRQNTVLSRVLGDGVPYAHLLTTWGDNDLAAGEAEPFLALAPYEVLCADTDPEDADGQASPIFHWTPQIWRPGAQDRLLLAVAEEELCGLKFVSIERRCLVSPYDGGIDVHARDASHAQELAAEFAAWLPNASASDPTRVIRASCPQERPAVGLLIGAGSSVYLDDEGHVTFLALAARLATDALLTAIASLPHITHLHLHKGDSSDEPSASVSDRGLARLAALRTLQFLQLAAFPGVTATTLPALRAALPACDVVDDEQLASP